MIGIRRKKWKIEKTALKESTEVLKNPLMGFYHIFQFVIGETYDLFSPDYLDREEESLLLLEFSLERFKENPVSDEGMEQLRTALAHFTQRDKDLILRFSYDFDGRAYEKEPMLRETVEQHIRQVGRTLLSYMDKIYMIQGFFIGNWGEMHGSRFLTEAQIIRLHEVLRETVGERVWIAVRRPSFLRLLSYETNDRRLCLYNDAILASDTDMGTYGQSTFSGDSRTREEELDYQAKAALHFPNGGEVVAARDKAFAFLEEPGEVLSTLQKMHVGYLNRDYDANAYRRWSHHKYPGKDAFRGKDLFEAVSAKLGYRLVLRELKMFGDEKLFLSIENNGFANHLFDIEGKLKVGEAVTTFTVHRRGISTQKVTPFQFLLPDVPKGSYELTLSLQRRRNGGAIHLAHKGYESADEIVLGRLIKK